MIQCHKLSFGYKGQQVFTSFDWELDTGSICGLLGPNGAGKTTLFKILTGLMFREAGELSILGYDPGKREEALYQKMTYVAEELATPDMTPLEYARICGPMYPRYEHQVFADLCQRFEVNPNKDFLCFSAGDLRKAWICVALATRTELILLDEPSKGLDIPAQAVLRKALTEAALDGCTIILSTHHVREVEGLLDHITLIDRGGHLRLNAPVETLYEQFSLVHGHTRDDLPAHALAYQRRAAGWTALLPEPSEAPADIPLELLFTGLCKKGKEVSHDPEA